MHPVYRNIRRIRVEKGLSQQNVADDLGLSLTGYAKIERGETSLTIERLTQLADYFEVSVFILLDLNRPQLETASFKDKEIEYLKQINTLLLQKLNQLENKK